MNEDMRTEDLFLVELKLSKKSIKHRIFDALCFFSPYFVGM
jgi:hypothetical protein